MKKVIHIHIHYTNIFFYSFFLFFFLFFFFLNIEKILLISTFFGWFILLCLVGLLFLTFNFFIKSYIYSKFVSPLNRFWRRTFSIFWLVEMCWFIIFLFCLATCSHEPVYYEEKYIYKVLYLGSYNLFITTSILLFLLLNYVYGILIIIKSVNFYQINIFLNIINFIFYFLFFIEIYQFIFIITFFFYILWAYDVLTGLFEISYDYLRFRPRMAFFSLVLIVKFWHCIFIIGSWIYFYTKSIESKRIRSFMLSMVYQNTYIFYMMCIIQFFSYIKFYVKLLFKKMWFWFFLNPIKILLSNFIHSIILFV